MKLRIAGTEKYSTVDGFGLRYTIFFQGCNHNCEGCHNPQTHNPLGGSETTTENIVNDILATHGISGVTISGGEPFLQYDALVDLCRMIKEFTPLNIWVYTGYSEDELPFQHKSLAQYVDAFVVGRYIQEERTLSLPFVGSKNQRIIYTK